MHTAWRGASPMCQITKLEAATWHVSVCFPCPPGTTHARPPAATPKLHAIGSGPRLLLRSAQTIPRPTSPPCTRHHPGHSTSNKPPSTTTCMHRTPPIGRPVTEPPPTDMTRDALQHHTHKIPSTKAPGCPAGSCVLGSPRSLARSNPPPPFFGLCTKIVPTEVRTRHLLLPSLTT